MTHLQSQAQTVISRQTEGMFALTRDGNGQSSFTLSNNMNVVY